MGYTSYKQKGGGEKRTIFCIPWRQTMEKDSSCHCWEAFEAVGSWLSAWLSINLVPTQNWLSDYIKQGNGCLCGSCPWTLLRRITGLNLLANLYRAHRKGLLCVGRACHEKLFYSVELCPAAIKPQESRALPELLSFPELHMVLAHLPWFLNADRQRQTDHLIQR